MKLTIGHLYPELLNLYGDRGNIQCLMKRCQWRGIEAETIAFEMGDTIDFSPARRTGNLRMHWNGQVKSEGSTAGGGVQIIAELESQEKYAGYLENGTKKMAARPFADKIKEKATPEIEKIYKEPYG